MTGVLHAEPAATAPGWPRCWLCVAAPLSPKQQRRRAARRGWLL